MKDNKIVFDETYSDPSGCTIGDININNNGLPWFRNYRGCEDWDITFNSEEEFLNAFNNSSEKIKAEIKETLKSIRDNIIMTIAKL